MIAPDPQFDSPCLSESVPAGGGVNASHSSAVADPHETYGLVPDEAASLVSLLFEPSDLVSFRPTESWTEGDRKASRVLYQQTRCVPASSLMRADAFGMMAMMCARERAHFFFGVCPRFGPRGYELAWQIRTARVLWADIDDCTTRESATARCQSAGLPQPSAIVSTGRGFHFYWRLASAYQIDDVGDPPRVVNEWIQIPGRPKRTVIPWFASDSGERINLNDPATGKPLRRNSPPLSAKALALQDIVAGIAKCLGADKTHDLTRLLRMPGTMNRKDERNGRPPQPCRLVECEPGRTWEIDEFQKFAVHSPDAVKRKQVAQVRLKTPRPIKSRQQLDTLDRKINACAVADVGQRSEKDFALCAFAIGIGMPKADLWTQIAEIGKFAEGGDRYFDLTWASAEHEAREAYYESQHAPSQETVSEGRPEIPDQVDLSSFLERFAPSPPPGELASKDEVLPAEVEEAARFFDGPDASWSPEPAAPPSPSPGQIRKTIRHDPAETPVAALFGRITSTFVDAGNLFRRSGNAIQIEGDRLTTLDSNSRLAAVLNAHAELVLLKSTKDGPVPEYVTLPPKYGNVWLEAKGELNHLPPLHVYTKTPAYTPDYRLVEPGYDAATGIYYHGPRITPVAGTQVIDQLLSEFDFKTPGDRTNYLSLLVTIPLVAQFIGSKPAGLFNANQPEVGKTLLAQIVGILRDGTVSKTCTYNANDEEFEKRLATEVKEGRTCIIIDNAKGKDGIRTLIDSAVLERSLTDDVLSYRQLGANKTIEAENSLQFMITANGAQVSRDIITRSLVINLFYAGDPRKRVFSIANPCDFAATHRMEILGELLGMIEAWKAAGRPRDESIKTRFNRKGWGQILGGILKVAGQPDFMTNQSDAAATMDPTRSAFEELVIAAFDHYPTPKTASDWVDVALRKGLLKDEIGSGTSRSQATRLGTLFTRYHGETFPVPGAGEVTFLRTEERNGCEYRLVRPEGQP